MLGRDTDTLTWHEKMQQLVDFFSPVYQHRYTAEEIVAFPRGGLRKHRANRRGPYGFAVRGDLLACAAAARPLTLAPGEKPLNTRILEWLACPTCGDMLTVQDSEDVTEVQDEGCAAIAATPSLSWRTSLAFWMPATPPTPSRFTRASAASGPSSTTTGTGPGARTFETPEDRAARAGLRARPPERQARLDAGCGAGLLSICS